MQVQGNGDARAEDEVGTDPAKVLLATDSPAALSALLGRLSPALDERLEAVLWSAHWPRRITSRPGALTEASLSRALREVSARRGGARPDPRYLVLCDDHAADVAIAVLREPLPADRSLERALALA